MNCWLHGYYSLTWRPLFYMRCNHKLMSLCNPGSIWLRSNVFCSVKSTNFALYLSPKQVEIKKAKKILLMSYIKFISWCSIKRIGLWSLNLDRLLHSIKSYVKVAEKIRRKEFVLRFAYGREGKTFPTVRKVHLPHLMKI